MVVETFNCQFVYRSIDGGSFINDIEKFEQDSRFPRPQKGTRQIIYSKNGKYCGYCSDSGVVVLDSNDGQVVLNMESRKTVCELSFSPQGRFVCLYERFIKVDDSAQPAHQNLLVVEVASGKVFFKFTQKTQTGWMPQWTDDESLFARLVTNSVQFFEADSPNSDIKYRCIVEAVQSFSVSPGAHPNLAVFAAERKGKPASIALYNVPMFDKPAAQKSFFRCDFVQFSWNCLGTSVLALATSDVDTTGKSYYGETSLYYLNAATKTDCKVELAKNGPIHDLCWNPNPMSANEFIVVYGSMPAQATLFDHRANPKHEICRGMRNFVSFNPQGRLFCVAGFGNLAGEIEFYDRETLKKVGSCTSSNASVCIWSPCGRFVLTGTVTPRLRVDNGFKLWHYSGTLVFAQDVNEMYSIQFRPYSYEDLKWPAKRLLSPQPPRSLIAADSVGPSAKAFVQPVGKYVPPSARKMQALSFNHKDGATAKAVPGAPKQKRAVPGSAKEPNANKSPAIVKATDADSSASQTLKKIMKVKKKLAQIEDLKSKQAKGEPLEQTQVQKIKTEAVLLKELQQLEQVA